MQLQCLLSANADARSIDGTGARWHRCSGSMSTAYMTPNQGPALHNQSFLVSAEQVAVATTACTELPAWLYAVGNDCSLAMCCNAQKPAIFKQTAPLLYLKMVLRCFMPSSASSLSAHADPRVTPAAAAVPYPAALLPSCCRPAPQQCRLCPHLQACSWPVAAGGACNWALVEEAVCEA